MEVPLRIRDNQYKKEIDEMIIEGRSHAFISDWLKEHGDPVSRQTIGKYHKFCFNINEEAVKVYQEKINKPFNDEVQRTVSTLELYDKFIAAGESINPSAINEDKMADLALKAAKQREDFLEAHGDLHAEEQTQLLREIRDELIKQDLGDILNDISKQRTVKRQAETKDTP